ncbi:MAG TPA: DUF4430 domain-containing protein [Syntrophomonadaceae bacterium]|nr:DUF4430 domain-containing protein [Syntrophomonadaceae bacterium]
MRRFLCLMLMLLVTILCAAGCGIGQADKKDNPNTKSTTVATQTQKPAHKTIVEEKDKENSKTNNTVKKPLNSAQPGHRSEMVTLMITRDFGKQVLFKKEVTIGSKSTVIDVLKNNIAVTTGYGGSYVKSIKGLESHSAGISGHRWDWFYYINGICADTGAGDYVLRPGEAVWWDYHEWSSTGFVNSAVIGSYPEPFTSGYRGKVAAAVIMSSRENAPTAANLEKALKTRGVVSVSITGLSNDLLQKRPGPAILIGTWNELKDLEYMDKLNSNYRKTGLGAHLTENSIELLDSSGSPSRTLNGSAGIITAISTGLGDANPLWVIAGTDQAGLQEAADILTSRPGNILGMYSAAVYAGEIIRLPL